eukprot:jgi/Picsp_1/5810/NSC_03169-R1_chlorophyll b reductase chloroplastic-like
MVVISYASLYARQSPVCGSGIPGQELQRKSPAKIEWCPVSRYMAVGGTLKVQKGKLCGLRSSLFVPNRRGCGLSRKIAPSAASGQKSYNVVVTGGTKGTGKAIAKEFLSLGDTVVLCSRDAARVKETVEELSELGKVFGLATDVTKAADVAKLADFAAEKMGQIDIWVNNAGTNAYTFRPILEQENENIEEVVMTNMLGVMYCSKEAIRIMRGQNTGGHVFNMDGAGADGGATPRFAAYGATKRSLDQFNKSLRAELGLLGIKNVGVHAISPGMVTTELLMAGADNKVSKFFINCLAEKPETVAEFLVPRMRKVPSQSAQLPIPNSFLGNYIRFLTPIKAYCQIALRLATGRRKNRFVQED